MLKAFKCHLTAPDISKLGIQKDAWLSNGTLVGQPQQPRSSQEQGLP